MKITKEQIPEWEELIRILSLCSIYRVSLHKMKGMSKTLSFFSKRKTPPTKVDSIYFRMITVYIYILVIVIVNVQSSLMSLSEVSYFSECVAFSIHDWTSRELFVFSLMACVTGSCKRSLQNRRSAESLGSPII